MQVQWVGSPNHYEGRLGHQVTHITLHIMAGYLAGTDSTFQDEARQSSATYGVGATGEVHQYVGEEDTPWSDSSYNSNTTTISIEHEGGLPQAPCTRECMDASAELCADIARRHGWDHLWHDGTNGNVWLHREVPGTDHPSCPDLAPNGLDVGYVISKANQLLGDPNWAGPTTQGEDMPVKTDPINWDGQTVTVEYAMQDLLHKLQALGDAKHISDMVWFGQGEGRVEDTPLYALRAILHAIEALADKSDLDLEDIQASVAQGVKQAIESIKTTVEVHS